MKCQACKVQNCKSEIQKQISRTRSVSMTSLYALSQASKRLRENQFLLCEKHTPKVMTVGGAA